MRQELQDIKRHIYEDGTISDSEVTMLEGIMERWGVGEEEVRLLIDLNNVLSGEEHAPRFNALYVERIAGFMLDGGSSISSEKWDWLKENMLKDSQIDALEKRLLAELRGRVDILPADFDNYA